MDIDYMVNVLAEQQFSQKSLQNIQEDLAGEQQKKLNEINRQL